MRLGPLASRPPFAAVPTAGERVATEREHERLGTEPVDGLRGFAVLLVVLYHTWLFSWLDPSIDLFGHRLSIYPLVRPGYLGVDIFFFVSAFCLAFPYLRARAAGTAAQSLPEFVRRRFLKIVPSYALALGVTVALARASGTVAAADWPRVIGEHVFFVQNIEYDRLSDDNSVLWSLAVEVQFYIVFPLLMRLFLFSPWATAGGMIAVAQLHRHAFAACCLRNEDVMRLLPAYLDLFAFGMIAAYLVVTASRTIPHVAGARWLMTLVAFGGAAGTLLILQWLDQRTYVEPARYWFPVTMRSLLGVTLAAFTVGSCLGYAWWRRLVGNRLLFSLSVISYNLYLWHTLVELFLAHHHIPYSRTEVPYKDPSWPAPFVAVALPLVVLVASAITYFVERPLLSLIKPQSFSFDYRRLTGLDPRARVVAGPGNGRPR